MSRFGTCSIIARPIIKTKGPVTGYLDAGRLVRLARSLGCVWKAETKYGGGTCIGSLTCHRPHIVHESTAHNSRDKKVYREIISRVYSKCQVGRYRQKFYTSPEPSIYLLSHAKFDRILFLLNDEEKCLKTGGMAAAEESKHSAGFAPVARTRLPVVLLGPRV